ncbi:acylhydrolase [Paraburkholderia ginsengiterrae]|uniref:Acylhydrolase n=1 Tax=Paraburkholderia ginsengiterrae TaxID=1462993 RepID=A0A1A9NHE9_9BURK|nr:SGNH/GDSL hydrolase family protein [Paraburkholderia ginsengiterrae]OAJ58354.1 acylhydrolase [Paraburkholderia ginsengiterrae]OAJ65574.1 acylhydrolase [Paraburkholderia ginsengiterrae]
MKQTASRKQHWLRVTQIAMASTAFALLAACGGGSDNNNNSSSTPAGGVKLQIVSFGDSLSDAGTYSPVIQGNFGGGRFTTNPGEVWTQKVAEYYGDTLKPAFLGGFGQPLVATGGFGYAQGGSDVVNAQGIGWAPNSMAATTVPVVAQVASYLSTNTSFNGNQLVLMNGGANDIFQFSTTANLQALGTALQTQYPLLVQAGKLPNSQAGQVAFIVGYLQQLANPQIATAASQLAAQVQKIVAAGATHVVVSTVPDIGNTPLGVTANASSPGAAALLSGITAAYNYLLVQNLTALGLLGTGKVIVIDAFTWFDQTLANYQALGFTVANTDTACNVKAMQANATAYATANPSATNGLTPAQYGQQFGSSLFCSPQTYTVAGADQTYIFADTVHASTHTNALFAQFVQQQIAATGLGK